MGCIILHAFNWTFNEIKERIVEIKQLGYRAVLTSPISYSQGNEWWMRYQPIDLRLIYSPLGTKAEFIAMIEAAKLAEIEIYVDIVINHMAHRYDADNLEYPGSEMLEKYKSDRKYLQNRIYGDIGRNQFSSADFHPKQIINNYQNVDEIRNFRIHDERVPNGLPDFALTENVILQQNAYLKALLEVGVKGFRIDAAKHVPVEHINGIIDEEIRSKAFVFAEVIPEQNFQIIREVLASTSISLYDFPHFFKLRKSFDWGESFKILEEYERSVLIDKFKSVTIVNTHDIPNNSAMKNQAFNNIEDELLAYTYILGRDGGCPLLFTDKGDNRDGVDSFNNRWKDLYKHSEISQMIDFHNFAHGSKMEFKYVSDGVMVVERLSKGFFAINKTANLIEIDINFSSLNGTLRSLFSNDSIHIGANNYSLKLSPRSKIMACIDSHS